MKRLLTATTLMAAAVLGHAAEPASNAGFFVAGGPSFGAFGDDFDGGIGANVTLGIKLRNEHSVEFEASYLDSAAKVYWSKVDATFVPLVGKYRVPFVINQNLTLSAAGVAGGLYERVKGSWTDRKDGAFVFGAEAAIDYAVSDRATIGAGITALYATKTDITTAGGIALWHFRASYRF